MIVISADFLIENYKKQLREKRDDTIKCIDNALQSASELKNADKDIIFDDLSDYFINDFSVTIVTIEKSIELLFSGIDTPESLHGLLNEIKTMRYFIRFLTTFSNTILEYKSARKDFHRWIKD